MNFSISHIINKFLPVVNKGNELSESHTLHDSSTTGTGTPMNVKDAGYALLAVKGDFSGLKLLVSGQAPDGSYYRVKVRNRTTGTIHDEITAIGLYDVDVRGFSNIRAFVSAINSGSVSVYGNTQAIEPIPMHKETLTVRDEVNSGNLFSTGQLTFFNTDRRYLFESSTIFKSITVKANEDNQGNLFIGNELVTNENGFILPPGASTTIVGNFSTDRIWVVPETINDGLSYGAVR